MTTKAHMAFARLDDEGVSVLADLAEACGETSSATLRRLVAAPQSARLALEMRHRAPCRAAYVARIDGRWRATHAGYRYEAPSLVELGEALAADGAFDSTDDSGVPG